MDLFSNFCNICYKTNDGNINNVSDENMKYLKDTLITFVGHADIINNKTLNLCHLCCDELIRSNKFREKCFSNLIALREIYFNLKSDVELKDGTKNALEKFVHEKIVRRNSLDQNNCPIAIRTDCHGIANISGDLNKDQKFNRQSESNEFKFDIKYNVESVRNSTAECDESQLVFTDEQLEIKNERLQSCEDEAELPKFERDVNVSHVNNSCRNDTLQAEFTKEEFDVKEENISEDFALQHFYNESGEYVVTHDIELPVAKKSSRSNYSQIEYMKEELYIKEENCIPEYLELETYENEYGDGLNVALDIATKVNEDNCGNKSISNEETVEVGMQLRSSVCDNISKAVIINTQPNRINVRKHHNRRLRTALQSGKHARGHMEAELYTCAVCNETFRSSNCLTRHASVHSGTGLYNCTVCNKTFAQFGNLIVHERIHSGDRPYKCPVCNKMFADPSNLIKHKRTHSGARPYECSICKRAFTHSSHLTVHERIHTGDRPYKCTVCDKTFTATYTLTKHERIHSGKGAHVCTVCNKTFIDSSNLCRHERIHRGDKPYKCTVCNKRFTESSSLTKHERTHSGARPYKCTVCNKAFTQSSGLTSHARVHIVRSNKL